MAQLQNKLKSANHSFVRWVAPQGIHLTLKFLGSISRGKVDEVIMAMERASQGISPFQLEFGDLGVFPDAKRPRVLWIGIGGEVEKLVVLQQRLEDALTPLGFARESRRFVPHLTLARLREGISSQERRSFGELVIASSFEVKYVINAGSINLMRSQLTPTGAIYSRLAATGLQG